MDVASLKDVAKNLLLRSRRLRSRHERARAAAGYDHEKDSCGYVMRVYKQHIGGVGSVRGKDCVEIGPGGNLGLGIMLLLDGARSAVALDTVNFIEGKHLQPLYEELVRAAGSSADPQSLSESLVYLAPVDISASGLETATVDVLVSHACFEHFVDPAGAIREIARLLRPGGVTSHQIDLRDHRDMSRPLRFLRLGDASWKLATSNRVSLTPSRWRASDYESAFIAAGLELVSSDTTDSYDVTDAERARFAPRFRRKAVEDLRRTGIFIVARKPQSGSGGPTMSA
jgi:SAM-dependent methyltransferase